MSAHLGRRIADPCLAALRSMGWPMPGAACPLVLSTFVMV